jgi:glucose-1-phosphate cytidylyltransferase
MKVVILAGGLGTRLGEETELMPKPMVAIGDKPILWHIMKTYSHYGLNDFIVCLGYKGHVIKDYFTNYVSHTSDVTINLRSGDTTYHARQAEPWSVTLVDTGINSQTGGRLRRIRSYIGQAPFCMTYGDGVSDVDLHKLISYHKNHGKLATVTSVTPPGRWGALKIDKDKVTGFFEKVETEGSFINAGYFVLQPQVFDLIDNDETIWEQEPMRRLTENGELMAYRHHGFWQCMDNPREKRDLEKYWQSGRAPWKVWP